MSGLNVWRGVVKRFQRYEDEIERLETKIENQRNELNKLLEGKKSRQAYIDHLHRMCNEQGRCYQCGLKPMAALFDGEAGLMGYFCEHCHRTVMFEQEPQ